MDKRFGTQINKEDTENFKGRPGHFSTFDKVRKRPGRRQRRMATMGTLPDKLGRCEDPRLSLAYKIRAALKVRPDQLNGQIKCYDANGKLTKLIDPITREITVI